MNILKGSMGIRVYSVMRTVITRIISNLDQRAGQTLKLILFHSALYVILRSMRTALRIMLKNLEREQR